jgi:hypothetical protein
MGIPARKLRPGTGRTRGLGWLAGMRWAVVVWCEPAGGCAGRTPGG